MEKRIIAALRALQASLERLRTLLAWYELDEAQSKGIFANSSFAESTRQDIRTEIGYFWKTSLEIEDALCWLPEDGRARMLARLQGIRARFHREVPTERFINP